MQTPKSKAYERFMASTEIDYERWHDGVPYDVDAIAELTPAESREVEAWAAIVDGLDTSTVMDGLTTAIDLAQEHRTPVVMDALFRAALRDDHVMAVHAAALLLFLYGKAKEPFDWDRRPFFLQFGEDDPTVRRTAFVQLCRECGVDPARYLEGDAASA